jgi:hypothetical protein
MGTSSILVPFSQRTYGVIGGERERRSRAPGTIFVPHIDEEQKPLV